MFFIKDDGVKLSEASETKTPYSFLHPCHYPQLFLGQIKHYFTTQSMCSNKLTPTPIQAGLLPHPRPPMYETANKTHQNVIWTVISDTDFVIV